MTSFAKPASRLVTPRRAPTEHYIVMWNGISIQVIFDPDPHGRADGYAHLEVQAQNREPLPIAETGYRAIIIRTEAMDDYGGPVHFVSSWLDELADTREWKAAQADRRQGRLF